MKLSKRRQHIFNDILKQEDKAKEEAERAESQAALRKLTDQLANLEDRLNVRKEELQRDQSELAEAQAKHQAAEREGTTLSDECAELHRKIRDLQAARTMANMQARKMLRSAEEMGFTKVDENTYVDAAHPGNRIVLPDGRRALNIRTWSEAYPGEPFDPRHPDVRITAKDAEILADFPDVNLDGVKIYEIDSSHRKRFYDNYAASTAYGDGMTWLGRHVPKKSQPTQSQQRDPRDGR